MSGGAGGTSGRGSGAARYLRRPRIRALHLRFERCLVTGGEAATRDLIERVASNPDLRVLNHYGPTETTVGSCTYDVEPGEPRPAASTVPIGRPISNTRTYVLDAHREPVPVGVRG